MPVLRPLSRTWILLGTLLASPLASPQLAAQSAELRVAEPSPILEVRDSEPPLRIAERAGVEPLAMLPAAAVGAADLVDAVEQWNASGRLPLRDGFVRPLPVPRRVTFTEAVTASPAGLHLGGALVPSSVDTVVWGAEIRVEGAHRLRGHLSDVSLPAGARLWVYGETGETVGPFGRELLDRDGLWTPSVGGPVLRIEAEIPREVGAAEPAGFMIDSVVELLPLGLDGLPTPAGIRPRAVDASCLVDVNCVGQFDTFSSALNLARRAIGQVHYIIDYPGGVRYSARCTGGLLNDAKGTGRPLFLTAHHCLLPEAPTSSVEVFWDYFTDACSGTVPSRASLPRSNGATLLARSKSSDFALLELLELPGNRVFLGWDADPETVKVGKALFRVSFPVPNSIEFPQMFSTQKVTRPDFPCTAADLTKFLYSEARIGGIFGGSSGSPALTATGQVVGQLYAVCGPSSLLEEGCSPIPWLVDGAFSNTYRHIWSFLAGGGDPGIRSCVPGEFTTCAVDGRFEITATSPRSRFAGDAGRVSPVFQGNNGGAFHFFLNEENFHLVIKIVKRSSGFFAVSIAGFENFPMTIQVRDTETDEVKTYFKPANELALPVDGEAFSVNP